VKEMAVIGDAWRPYRGAAAHLFWAYYKVVKANGFDPVPAEKPQKIVANGKRARAAKPPVKRTAATPRPGTAAKGRTRNVR
jgi:DNA-3-methyladenine glycosylase II